MPTDKDFKRLVRARMGRTGEAYTTARAQLRPTATPPGPTRAPTPAGPGRSGAATRTRPPSPGCSPPSASPTRPPGGP
jgi:hypothetical protein